MKAVQIIARGQAVFVDVPKPSLQPGTALVKTLRLSLCGSDIRHLHYLPEQRYPSPTGETGHEMVGQVEAIDAGGARNGLQVGDRVLCLAPDHRAMAEYYLAPIDRLLPLDPATPLEHSVQAQQLGTVLYAAQRLPDLRGKAVAVIGQGSAGLWFNFVLKGLGAARVIALDTKAYRLRYSRSYGATDLLHNAHGSAPAAIRALNGGQLADVVIEAAGETDAIQLAIAIAQPDGFVLAYGVPRMERMDFPVYEFFGKTLTIKAIVGTIKDPGHACTRQALDYINRGTVDAGHMITHTFPFADVFAAYELHHLQDEGAVKIVVDMEA